MRSLKATIALCFCLLGYTSRRRPADENSSNTSWNHVTSLRSSATTSGNDYFLANYSQMIDYWRKLDRESDRMKMVRIGTTAEGRRCGLAIVHIAGESQEALAGIRRFRDDSRWRRI